MSIILIGTIASLGAGLMTGVGAIPVLFGKQVSRRTNDMMLGFAAGVMISASFFSLILPGIEAGEAVYGTTPAAAFLAALGIALGAGLVAWLNRNLPHEHFVIGREGADPGAMPKIWLFIIAITIHNFPEGMAVGIGFGGGNVTNGISLATGIGLQNAPEGLAVALALRGQGYSKPRAFVIALLTGLVEPVGGLLGVALVHLSVYVLPLGLTFAAGAMLYIISHEIIPETHRHGHQNRATTGLIVGLILMMLLDVILG
ncbi:ZIP family metal transporter [Lutimaribacter sp. EGI FJ00015]|uniref:ZIP family metal transporter n=1 Tax=Lutimaribacter degradans TaxID=2945989 RepID=A0ACC5ZZZ3_9RHOB|nr:ZIP family metal transporter [Lutimaribacter sp. EGI FJ00013]MCM2563902.1 ZIP family metal transporter [Lutimaribacter sp. EGI FJ00013]MCO0615092.1 ZIP family metal transporter [Lutimaribacter sp. EGI FJ00015]MCO0637732.1 ZIP family metal transporter [Lutimaribacter sp. EGI FJ00014]